MIHFRHILVKYADRGLVKDGKVSKLFRYLYSVNTILSIAQLFGYIISSYFYDKLPITLAYCLQKDNSQISWRIFITGRAYTFLPVAFQLVLYFSSTYFVKSKCHKIKTPRMMGNYQRNIVTFRQTVVYSTISYIYSTFQQALPLIVSDQNQKTVYLYFELGYFLILNLSLHMNLLLHLHKNMPMLFYNFSQIPDKMKPRSPQIVPRRDVNNLVHQNSSRIIYVTNIINPPKHNCPVTSYHKSKIIYVKPKKNVD